METKKIGFIDYYLDEWHANNYPALIRETSGGELEVAYAYGMIDSPLPGGMTTDQWCEKYNIPRCLTIEELIEKSDCLLVLSPDNCEMHEQLCQLPLRSGKLTYVDKTFAPDKETAERLFALAEEYGTPCYPPRPFGSLRNIRSWIPRRLRRSTAGGQTISTPIPSISWNR